MARMKIFVYLHEDIVQQVDRLRGDVLSRSKMIEQLIRRGLEAGWQWPAPRTSEQTHGGDK